MSTALARNSDPETSHAAAEHVDTETLETRVLFALALFQEYGATTHQIAAYLGLSLVTISPRMAPLRRKGKVIDSGVRDNGRTVWQLVAA